MIYYFEFYRFQILYNALTHTFQSHRVLRYLVRTLTVATRYEEAGKALKLYVELFSKARETNAKQIAKEMKHLRKRAGLVVEVDTEKKFSSSLGRGENVTEVEDDDDEEEEYDIDSDREFIEIGAFGVRLLCRYLDNPRDAVNLAEKMKDVLSESDSREVRGKVESSLGIALGCLAKKGEKLTPNPLHSLLSTLICSLL